jgi:hypothetical protein
MKTKKFLVKSDIPRTNTCGCMNRISMFLLLIIFAFVSGWTPERVLYNISEGRLPNGEWCKIEILPSHLGLSVSDANSPAWQANYSLYLPYWSRSDLIQITASKDSHYRWRPAIINSATSYIRGSGTLWVDFKISWATETLELYVGMINATGKSDEYCSVWSIQYGACASYQAPDGNCSSFKVL